MSLTPPTQPNFGQSVKGFWDRSEGKVGKAFLIVSGLILAGGLVFFWGLILPFLLGVAANTVQLGIMIATIAGMLFLATNHQVHFLIRNIFQSSMRWVTGQFIAIDPIGILRNNIATLEKQETEFDAAIASIAGTKQGLEKDIANHKAQFDNNKRLSDATAEQGRKKVAEASKLPENSSEKQEASLRINELVLMRKNYASAAGMENQAIIQEQPLLIQTTKMYDRLVRIRDLAHYKIIDYKQQADHYSRQRDMILSAQKALGAATRILKGDPAQLAAVDQTVSMLNNEADMTIGALNDFNRWSEKGILDMDIKSDAAAAEAFKIFDEMESKLKPTAAIADQSAALNFPIIDTAQDNTGVYVANTSSDEYKDIFK